jgi:hypothetical protein
MRLVTAATHVVGQAERLVDQAFFSEQVQGFGDGGSGVAELALQAGDRRQLIAWLEGPADDLLAEPPGDCW